MDDQGKGYRWDFMNEPLDVDGDGKLDVVAFDWFQMHCTWYRNIGTAGGEWPEASSRRTATSSAAGWPTSTATARPSEVVPSVQRTVWYEVVGAAASGRSPSTSSPRRSTTSASGSGDINGDGRPDFIRPGAWYKAPANRARKVE